MRTRYSLTMVRGAACFEVLTKCVHPPVKRAKMFQLEMNISHSPAFIFIMMNIACHGFYMRLFCADFSFTQIMKRPILTSITTFISPCLKYISKPQKK